MAAVEDDDVVADLLELAEQVGGDEDGDAEVAADALHEPQHVGAGGGVEAVGRLVEEDQPRVVGERLGELGALLHAGGVAAHRPVALLVEADVAQHVGGRARGPRDAPRPDIRAMWTTKSLALTSGGRQSCSGM